LLTLFSLTGCRSTQEHTITYSAYLIKEHPKAYLGCYVKLVGVITDKRPQDLFPPYPGELILCDNSGCIYLHDDYHELSKYLGKKVKVYGYPMVTTFNFPYIDVLKVVPVEGEEE
jgi:hypothetical protein